MVFLAQIRQQSVQLGQGSIRLRVAIRSMKQALEVFLDRLVGLVDASFSSCIVVFRLTNLVGLVVGSVPDQHVFTLQLLDSALERLPTDQQRTVAYMPNPLPGTGLREPLTKLALETRVRSGTAWTVPHLLGWLSQHTQPIL